MASYKKEVIEPGDMASKLAHKVNLESYGNSSLIEVLPWGQGFRGPVTFRWNEYLLRGMYEKAVSEMPQNDGAGHKPGFFTLISLPEFFGQLGWEIIVMCADDIMRWGGMPAWMMNQLDVKKITQANFPLVEAMLNGYGGALKQARLANITGETALMKFAITTFCDDNSDDQLVLTWNGACMGIVHEDKKLFPEKIEADMPIVGLVEPGTRCNGNSNSVKIIQALWGMNAAEIRSNPNAMEFVKKLAIPSLSYSGLITRVHGYDSFGITKPALVDIVGAAQITGGGIWEKLADILPDGIGAEIDALHRSEVLAEIQEKSFQAGLNFSDKEMLGDYHGSCGMHVICKTEADAERFIKEAAKDGFKAVRIGKTIRSDRGEIRARSPYRENRWISSDEWHEAA